MTRIYMDYAATTPLCREAWEAMTAANRSFGNPSSPYEEGRAARAVLDQSRRTMQQLIGAAQPREVIFTGGGSESDALAICGYARRNRSMGNHIITSAIEHHAVLHACEAMKKEGFRVTVLSVDAEGFVHPQILLDALDDETILVSIQLANNEIGTIQAVEKLAAIAHDRGAAFHCDAVQAFGSLPVDVQALGVDLLSLSAHKFYGPRGVGVLYLRQGVAIEPLIYGGQQEQGVRAGTENVMGIAGMVVAAERAEHIREAENARLQALQDQLIEAVLTQIPESRLNGSRNRRLVGNVHFSFGGVNREALLMRLDLAGLSASAGSACASGTLEPSHVMTAIGADDGAPLRLSMGMHTNAEEVAGVVEILQTVIQELREKETKK